jgi:TonB family protein
VDQGQEKLKAQQQKLTDQAKTEGAAGKYDDALRLLEQAVSLNGSNPEIQGLKDQYTKAKTADVHTQAILAQEGQFWDQGVAAFNRDRLDEAAGNFQKILPLQSQGGIKASDANDYLNTRIPNRKKADQLFSDAQQLAGQTNDLASLQKAQGDLNQIASLDAGRQDATNLLGTVTTRINELNAAASTAKTQQDQFNQLKAQFADPATSKDSQKLQSLQGQFRTIENSGSPQASEARNYAENLIPTAMNALKPPAVSTGGTPPPPPAAALLKVQIVSSPHQNAPGLINSKVPQPSSYLDEAPAFAAPPTVPASLKGASGSVVVRLTVDENGNVIGGGYLSGDTSLGTAVVNAAKGAWHFNAPKIKGKPYQAVVVVNVQF